MMSYSSSIGNYFCFSLIVYVTVLVVHFLLQVPKARLTFGIKKFIVSCYYGISLHFVKRG